MNPSFRLRGLAAALWLPLAVLASPANATQQFVVKMAGEDGSILIPGESAEPGYEGWIDACAFGQSIGRPVGEAFVGKSGFTFQKSLDAASPYLALAAMKGRTIPSVIIKCLGEDRSLAPACVELNHVRITGCQTGSGCFSPLAGAGDDPLEEVTLVWSQVVLRYQGEGHEETRGEFVAHESTADPSFDDDGDGTPNDLDPDDDNDAIDDDYETANGLNPFADDAGGDLDGDRQNNLDEAVAGTRANDGSDFFKIDSLVYRDTPEGPQAVVTLTARPGRAYTLKATADLAQPRDAWFTVNQFEVPAGGEAGPVEIVLSGPMVANAGRLFFAAEVDTAGAP
ncbi:type VI secretion system tube protein Hcp [Luteolibacter marinus]|uniref:type VI secretion system tube protein Hcp n=1 Tax=Luteolibacter marinus TaxID=2776705 RepID=UPI00186869A2|nr:type VI secretion system tube protein Hcp [Luteolibacter marinus]